MLKAAFDAYVATLGDSPDDPRVVTRAMDDVHTAVRLFADASVRTCGWGNPFVLPPGSEEADAGRKNTDVVQIDAHYKLRVRNPYAFRALVVDRARKAGQIPHEDIDTPAAQLHELFAIDGWDPHRYRSPDLEVLQARWSVS